MLVVADWRDPVARRLWEDQFQTTLAKRNVDAVPSYGVTSASPADSAAVREAVLENGFDGAVILQPLQAERTSYWVPGYVSQEPVTWFDRWSRGYTVAYRPVHHPGYRVNERITRQRILVWSRYDGGRLIWAATAEVTNPSGPDDVRSSVANGVVPELTRAKVL